MKQYYTSIETDNGRYVGIIYSSSNNEVLYRSAPYHTQAQATLDITQYLRTQEPPTKNTLQKPETSTVQSGTYHPAPQRPHRCCGR